MESIQHSPPAHARIRTVTSRVVEPQDESGFTIQPSADDKGANAEILPDLATCAPCRDEMLDVSNRRYHYPFISCTQCGPRYSIVQSIPYDRAHTSLRRFVMCTDCRAEYDDPTNRRFHAQTIACPACGPQLRLLDDRGRRLAMGAEALALTVATIREGRIVAVKGLGGFHLLADARSESVIRSLRQRKRRPEKPFAVMFADLAQAHASCELNPAAIALLSGSTRPIVLLPWRGGPVTKLVAPDQERLGALLPYTPLHHLLMQELDFPVVATSGNLSGESLVIDEVQALDRLAGVADWFLSHDQPIVRPIDDSVAQIVQDQPQLLRRARGYAPTPIRFNDLLPDGLAFGGQLKSTVALISDTNIVLSQHLGDLTTTTARQAYHAALTDMLGLQGRQPRLAICDPHPDYASSQAAENSGLPVIKVQHHVAHAAACLAEHGLAPPALCVVWDGMGYGTDGTLWGGEFLQLSPSAWQRRAHLRTYPLPGGEAAVREPRRAALGLLYAAYGENCFTMTDLAPLATFSHAESSILRTMLARNLNTPITSSIGRLFDAWAALIGLCQRTSYEGQAAMTLESAASLPIVREGYSFAVREAPNPPDLVLDWQPALEAMLADWRAGIGIDILSAGLHGGLVAAIVAIAERIGERCVVLSGGCFQNSRLTEAAIAALSQAGFEPIWHQRIPPNDGGIALGQAAWAIWMSQQGGGYVSSCTRQDPQYHR
jgi:hydrogenase maturation protein HypF